MAGMLFIQLRRTRDIRISHIVTVPILLVPTLEKRAEFPAGQERTAGELAQGYLDQDQGQDQRKQGYHVRDQEHNWKEESLQQ